MLSSICVALCEGEFRLHDEVDWATTILTISETRTLIGQRPGDDLIALADHIRELSSQLLRVDHEDPSIEEVRRSIEQATERLAAISSTEDAPRFSPASDRDSTRPYYFPGALEPQVHVAMPWMTGTQEADRRYGKVRFDLIHEGPPGYVHGGFVAWMFDQVFGQHVVEGSLEPGPTHRLEVTYRRPTPLLRELRYEVRTDRVDGRKAFVAATLHCEETLTAEASGIFVRPKKQFMGNK